MIPKPMDPGELARRLGPTIGFERLEPGPAKLKLEIIRRLATGRPVNLAQTTLSGAATRGSSLDELVKLGAKLDDKGRITAFGGLSQSPTRHRLRVGGQDLYAWCAADTLFLPALLGQAAEVESSCPVTGTPVRLRVTPQAIEHAEPEGIVVSFVVPAEGCVEKEGCGPVAGGTESPGEGGPVEFQELVGADGAFCGNVHFFRSAEDAEPWLAAHPNAFTLPLNAAFELSRTLWADPLLR